MIKAVVFDLDGTLIDSAEDLCVALNRLLTEEGLRPLASAEVVPMIGDGATKLSFSGKCSDDLPTARQAGEHLHGWINVAQPPSRRSPAYWLCSRGSSNYSELA